MSWPSPCACRAFMTNPQSSPDTSIHMYRTAHCGSCHSSHLPLNIHRSNWEWWHWRQWVLGLRWRTIKNPSAPFGVYRLASLLSWPTAASRTLDLGVRLPCRPCLSGWKDPTKPVELSAEPPTADQGEETFPMILSRLPLRYDNSSMSFEFCWRKNSTNSPSSAL